ncbi:MAG TPA: hypothetical protein PJ986_16295 [Gammaproteobacteria bacterium]|nr:hypothetical protein [Gammaproteobacteria bacterium]
MSERMFTQAELDALCRPPRDQMLAVLADGDGAAVKAKYAALEDAFLLFHQVYHRWVALEQAFLYERYGHEGLYKAVSINPIALHAMRMEMTPAELLQGSRSAKDEMNGLIDAGDAVAIMRRYDELERGFRNVHDLYREWLSLLLSHVYREYGIDALEQCLRHSSGARWMPWMMEEVETDARVRIVNWTALMLANFASFRLEEDDEKFTLHQDPCGSCGRQIRMGCHELPLDLAIVKEKHPITFNEGNVTVYQTHLAVMHTIMPIERIGAPWPAIRCPAGATGGPCRIVLFKNAKTAAAEDYERVGLRKPKTAAHA